MPVRVLVHNVGIRMTRKGQTTILLARLIGSLSRKQVREYHLMLVIGIVTEIVEATITIEVIELPDGFPLPEIIWIARQGKKQIKKEGQYENQNR